MRASMESEAPVADSPHRGRAGFAAVILVLMVLTATFTAASAANADQRDLASVRGAVARYHNMDRAMAHGWGSVEGLNHCFQSEALGGMGYHLIDTSRLDTALDLHRPEALVYIPKPNGNLRLGAVEWIVPAQAWHDEGHDEPPTVLDQHLHLNDELGVYVLHAWIFERNPAGMFEDFNPRVRCPL